MQVGSDILGIGMSRHRAGHAVSIPSRRHRVWPWVVSILALLVVLLGVWILRIETVFRKPSRLRLMRSRLCNCWVAYPISAISTTLIR